MMSGSHPSWAEIEECVKSRECRWRAVGKSCWDRADRLSLHTTQRRIMRPSHERRPGTTMTLTLPTLGRRGWMTTSMLWNVKTAESRSSETRFRFIMVSRRSSSTWIYAHTLTTCLLLQRIARSFRTSQTGDCRRASSKARWHPHTRGPHPRVSLAR